MASTLPLTRRQTRTPCSLRRYSAMAFRSSPVLEMLEPSRIGGSIHMPNTSSTPRKNTNGIKRRCPDCGAGLVKRSSESQHVLMSRTFLVCKNAVCGATFAGVDEITHRLSPASQPNPEISLPYAPSAIRRNVLQELGLATCQVIQVERTTLQEKRP